MHIATNEPFFTISRLSVTVNSLVLYYINAGRKQRAAKYEKKEKITHYIRYLDVVKKVTDLLNRVWTLGLAVFVDVDLHGLVTTIWNKSD